MISQPSSVETMVRWVAVTLHAIPVVFLLVVFGPMLFSDDERHQLLASPSGIQLLILAGVMNVAGIAIFAFGVERKNRGVAIVVELMFFAISLAWLPIPYALVFALIALGLFALRPNTKAGTV